MQRLNVPLHVIACSVFAFVSALTAHSSQANEITVRSEATLAVSSSAVTRLTTWPIEALEQKHQLPPSGERKTLETSFRGYEKSQCRDYGRSSYGNAVLSTRVLLENSGFEADLTANVLAQGGLFRKCSDCSFGTCFEANDVNSNRTVIGTIVTQISIDYPGIETKRTYQLTLKPQFDGDKPNRSIDVILANGDRFTYDAIQQKPIFLYPGTTTKLEIKVTSHAKDIGGCCQSKSAGQFLVRGTWSPIPDLLSQSRASGNQSDSNKVQTAVGLLISVNKLGEPTPLCTATIIGRRTVLTSARCKDFRNLEQNSVNTIWFVPGSSMQKGLLAAVKVTSWSTNSESSSANLSNDGTPREELVVAYVTKDLNTGNFIAPEIGADSDQKAISAVSFFPDDTMSLTGGQRIDWVRKSTPIEISTDNEKASKEAKTLDGTCLRGSGAPVFSENSGKVYAVLVSQDGQCRSQVPVFIKDHLNWLGTVTK